MTDIRMSSHAEFIKVIVPKIIALIDSSPSETKFVNTFKDLTYSISLCTGLSIEHSADFLTSYIERLYSQSLTNSRLLQ